MEQLLVPPAEEALKEAVEFERFSRLSPDLHCVFNGHGTLLHINHTCTAVLGFAPQELVGKSYAEFLFLPEVSAITQPWKNRARAGQQQTTTHTFRRKDGRAVTLACTTQWVSDEGVWYAVARVAAPAVALAELPPTPRKSADDGHRYKSLFDHHPDAAFSLDIDGYIKAVNAAGCALLQLQEAQVVQQHFTMFIHEKQLDQCLNMFWSSISGKAAHVETIFISLKELKVDISLTVIPIHQNDQIVGVYALVRNISQAKRAERELQKLSAVASKIKNPILVTDRRGRIEWVNAAFTTDTGYRLDEIKGLKPTQVLTGPDTRMDAYRDMAEKVTKNKGLVREEFLKYNKDGSVAWLHLELTPILDEKGNLNRVVTIATDITDIKKSQQERIRLTDVLLRQNKDLQQFGYIVSHNLRAPVANIMGLVDLLAVHRQEPAFVDKIIDNLKGASHHLDSVIRDLNHILTLRSDLVETKEKINLQELTNDILNSVRQQLEGSKALVELDFVPESYLTSVRSYITSILQNLITNAIKYRSPERQLKLSLRTYYQKKGGLCLEVQDNGLGINLHKEKNNVFKLYKRFHFHTEGKGLGLHLVKTQIEALGGKISVNSTVGEGTTFTVHFKK
ncbi:PAS domain-containing sensor histidine kinase [Rufibacter sp. LB8]|uniref:PAS domain-containing sensor histidine kinase n=1 Tax=Rufibacter sp. LB8 TaxID=2777781 RepID=UPI00178C5868|nr:PAS domain-containing sensor histidine kinase [Rufibacter sp. LB8]